MNFFDENKFFLKNTDCSQIVFNKVLSKNQKIILDMVLNEMYSSRQQRIMLSFEKIFSSTSFTKAIELVTPIEKLTTFKIQAAYQDLFSEFLYISYTIIGSFSIEKNAVQIDIDSRFYNASVNRYGDIYNITKMIKLQNKNSLIFYNLIDKLLKDEDTCIIKLDKLKEVFGLDDKYNRFYDVKTRVLMPVVDDINSVMDFNIDIEEVRLSASMKSKVAAVRIVKVKDKKNVLYKSIIEDLKKYISDEELAGYSKLFFDYIAKNSIDEFRKNYEFAVSLKSPDLLNTFVYCLKYNSAGVENEIAQIEGSCSIVAELERKFRNIDEFTSKLTSTLLQFENYDYYDRKLAESIKKIKYTKLLYYKAADYTVYARYNEGGRSVIRILK